MKHKKNDSAVSEVIGALLLVVILMTGLSIIFVLLISGPPPSSSTKAILSVKCSWCPDIPGGQYDILIGHEGGEDLSTSKMRITILNESSSKTIESDNLSIFPPETGLFRLPYTCDGLSGDPLSNDATFSRGQSLKFNYSGNETNPPKSILVQEPSTSGYSTISQFKLSYIQNLTSPSTETGYRGLKYISKKQLGLYPYIGSQTGSNSSDPDSCDVVEFTYINTNNETITIEYGNTLQSMYNYIEPVSGWYSDWDITYSTDTFTGNHSDIAVKINNFSGKIIYNLGSFSTEQVSCP